MAKKTNVKLTDTWKEVYGNPYTTSYPTGFVGIELELEYKSKVPAHEFCKESKYWEYHEENSLRDGFELVLSKPLLIFSEDYVKAMDEVDSFLKVHKNKLLVTYRTSLHVHVNIQEYTWRQIYNVVLNTYLFENVLSYKSSANRKGNLFCLRGCDAEAGLFLLANYIKGGDISFSNVGINGFKYGALNMAAITQRGSVEFRFMDASLDVKEISGFASNLCVFVMNAANTDVEKLIDQVRENTIDLKSECKKIMGSEGFHFFCSSINFNSQSAELMVQDNLLGIIHVLGCLKNKKGYRKFTYVDDSGIPIVPATPSYILAPAGDVGYEEDAFFEDDHYYEE